MPPKADYIFEVHIRIPEAFTLDTIVRSPRTFKPKDVADACNNNELLLKEGSPPEEVTDLATYIMTDFFAMSHGTGLYNRQRQLWESLSQVNTISVKQLSVGLMKKKPIPVFDLAFLDYKQKPLVYVSLVTAIPEKQTAVTVLKQAVSRAGGKSSLNGFLCCFRGPFPFDALDFVQKATDTQDPIGRYESIMPGLKVPIDLLEMSFESFSVEPVEEGAEAQQQSRTVFQLVHPDLQKGKIAVGPAYATKSSRTKSAVMEEE